MNPIEKREKRIESILTARAAELDTLMGRIDKCRERISEAQTALEYAELRGDSEAYVTAAENREKAEKDLAMFERFLSNRTDKGGVSEEETDNVISSILAYQSKVEAEFHKVLTSALAQIDEAGRQACGEINRGDNAIRSWCSRIRMKYNPNVRGVKLEFIPEYRSAGDRDFYNRLLSWDAFHEYVQEYQTKTEAGQ